MALTRICLDEPAYSHPERGEFKAIRAICPAQKELTTRWICDKWG